MTRLCVAIFVHSVEEAVRDAAIAAEAGADMVELRIDTFNDPAALVHLVEAISLPSVVTCRPTWEGGRSELEVAERVGLQHWVAEDEASYIDTELASGRV